MEASQRDCAPQGEEWKPNMAVESCPVYGEDRSIRGYVRVHTDRITPFAIVIDTTSFLDPYEARRFAQALEAAADQVERR